MSEISSAKRREVSVINWLGTLILSIIPGLNLVMFIIWAITSRRAVKRNFAKAAIILIALLIVITVVVCALWGEQLVEFFNGINPLIEQSVETTPSVTSPVV
ncbi:MAG: hypothetical protein Q4D04_04265 [Clostridia bacterium]|nr:hypothetical protein [Clostridia bacterium]